MIKWPWEGNVNGFKVVKNSAMNLEKAFVWVTYKINASLEVQSSI